ncbi:MAG: helix-hairpin-helix domain-containing protein [Polyangiaceae bacterium]|nr:helix-hairpin-helix domain-containing protein [Polyangiaceae bacterium]
MTTTDLDQEPPGPEPASARSAPADDRQDGGPSSAPAASGRTQRSRRSATASSPIWASGALKAAAGVIGILALAGIGTASLARGSDGVPFHAASSLLGGGAERWLAVLTPPSPVRPSHSHAGKTDAGAEPAAEPSSSQAAPAPQAPAADGSPSGDAGAGPSGITPDGKVVLNLADAEELTRLPSVGPKRAQAILALRARLKRFRRATDLLRVRGIGPKTLKRMLPHLVVDAPAPAVPAGDAGMDGGAK